jgi:hypothetical protein
VGLTSDAQNARCHYTDREVTKAVFAIARKRKFRRYLSVASQFIVRAKATFLPLA